MINRMLKGYDLQVYKEHSKKVEIVTDELFKKYDGLEKVACNEYEIDNCFKTEIKSDAYHIAIFVYTSLVDGETYIYS